MSYRFLFDIALILISTKIFGLITRKVNMPQVVGALLAGLILGPACLDILQETDFIMQMSELGVIVLMFTAGLETDVNELKKTGKASLVIAILGVVVPLIAGLGIAYAFNSGTSRAVLLENIFIGIILTATSVSITVETLKELGKLSTNVGNAILGAALIDDILGVVALTLITSLADQSVNVMLVMLKIVMFFVFAGVFGWGFYWLFNKLDQRHHKDLRRFVIASFTLCLLLAFIAEAFFGVADITGAFIAGVILSNTERRHYINNRFETLAYMLLSPMFFASIGIKVEIVNMSKSLILFTVILLIGAIISKVIGCGIGAKVCKYNIKESFQIGSGMVSRGEVALIVANKGIAMGILTATFLTPIVIVVVITTIISPILLKIAFKDDNNNIVVDNKLVDNYIMSNSEDYS